MVEFGCCLSAGSFVPQMGRREKTNILNELKKGITLLEDNAYDFVELTVASVTNLSLQDYNKFKAFINKKNIKILAFNSFIPGNIPLTGPEANYNNIEEYLELALSRVSNIGGQYIIFGSGEARSYPDNFSREEAIDQIISFLQLCNKYALKYNIDIAVEPLNKKESNVINTVAEAHYLISELNLSRIGVLADSYHMYMDNEVYQIIDKVKGSLFHVHIADIDRLYPGHKEGGAVDFKIFFSYLKSIGYNGGISAECKFNDIKLETKESLNYVQKVWNCL